MLTAADLDVASLHEAMEQVRQSVGIEPCCFAVNAEVSKAGAAAVALATGLPVHRQDDSPHSLLVFTLCPFGAHEPGEALPPP